MINVVSVFDGMSCGKIALDKLGIKSEYFASEIDKYAIKVSDSNYPGIKRLGDIRSVQFDNGELKSSVGTHCVGSVDLFIGGSPCQSISNLGDGTGLDGKSGLFFEWLQLRGELNPRFWLLENVVGSKKAIDTISKLVGCEPILINSNLVSGQNRARYYWTNINVTEQPTDLGICLKDVLDEEISADSILTPGRLRWLQSEKGVQCVKKRYAVINPIKANCLTARSDASWNCNYVTRDGLLTKLSPEEYEKLQTVPVGYTKVDGVPSRERYKMLGNGWTVDVIAHILSYAEF